MILEASSPVNSFIVQSKFYYVISIYHMKWSGYNFVINSALSFEVKGYLLFIYSSNEQLSMSNKQYFFLSGLRNIGNATNRNTITKKTK